MLLDYVFKVVCKSRACRVRVEYIKFWKYASVKNKDQ